MTPQAVFAALRNKKRKDQQSTMEIGNELRPADLFCYLAARFGPPNGIQNFLRADHSDNLIHWDWTLRHDAGVIVFWGMSFRTEVLIMGIAPGDDHKPSLIEQIKADFEKHGPKMAKIRKDLEHWTEFVNPYQRVRRSVERLLEELDALDLRPEKDRLEPFAAGTAPDEIAARWGEVARRYSRGFGLCFGIRSMLPVMAEAFVNLVLFILMRSEIRADQRLNENAFRQPIDIRIKSLSINCVGFRTRPDYSSEVCREYHRLVNERNDLLHGNVAVEKLKFNQVYFWGKVPVFKEYRSFWERSLQIEAETVGLEAVRAEVKTVNALTTYILSCLEDKVREEIGFVVRQHELGRNEVTGRVGVLFPGWLVDFRPAPAQDTKSTSS